MLERHRDPAAHHLRLVPDQVQPGLELGQRRLDVRQERLRRGSQPHAAAVADQQFRPDDGAGPRDPPAHRRLRHAQHLGGRGDVLRAAEFGQQGQQRQQLHELLVLDVHGRPSGHQIRICIDSMEIMHWKHVFGRPILRICHDSRTRPRRARDRQPGADPAATLPPWAGHPKGSAAYGRILAGLAFAGVATFAQLYSTQAVLPILAADLQVTAAEAALTISLATVGLAVTVLPWSFLADRIGRVRAMMWGISAATVLGLLVPLAPSFPMLLGLRMLEGMALGGIPAIAIAYLNEEVNKAHAALAAGSYVAGTTLGGLAGRLVAGPVGRTVGLAGRGPGRLRPGHRGGGPVPGPGAAGPGIHRRGGQRLPRGLSGPWPATAATPGCWPSTSRRSC